MRMRPLALCTVVVSRWPTLGDHLPRERREPCVPGSFANYVTFSCYPQSVFSGDEGLTTAQLRWQRSDWQS